MKTRAERRKERKMIKKSKGDGDGWLSAINDFILLPLELLFYIFKN